MVRSVIAETAAVWKPTVPPDSLEQAAGMTIKEFFPLLREKKSSQLAQVWKDYLNHLAFAMKNLNLIIDAPVIISGYLAPYFTDEDSRI